MNANVYPALVMPLSEEDGGGFAAYIPDLPGCMGDGETQDAAILDAYEAAEAWLETNIELGREVPEPGSAIEAARERQEALLKALQAALHYADHADGKIAKLETQIKNLIALMSDDRKGLDMAAAVESSSSKRTLCH